jgi:phasin
MTETMAAATKAKTAKHAASPFGLPDYGIPNFEMPKFDMSNMEMPEAFREMGIAQAKDNWEKIQAAAEEATELLKGTYATAAKGATDYNLKLIEIARTNTRAAFDYVHELWGVKSPSEFIELSTAQMRKQFEIVSGQNKELCTLAQEIATEAAGTIKTGVSKALNKAP